MIEAHASDGILTLRLNRPDKANSLTKDMLQTLCDHIAEAAGHEDLKALVLTGTGKVFSAGADLEQARAGLATDPVWERLSTAISDLPILTIAALNGTVAGGAFGMVLAADLRISVSNAGFFYPVMKLGFLPQPSDVARMHDLIGPARTKMILMAGAKLSAEDALRYGLIDQITDDLESELAALVADASNASRDHILTIKQMITPND